MAKELNFQDGNDVLKYQDSNSALQLYLSEDGLPFDLSRLDSLTLKVGNENGYLLEKPVDLTTVSSPQSGNVTVPLDGDIMTKLIPGDYNIELWSEVNPIIYDPQSDSVNISVSQTGLNDNQAIFPSDGNLVITVDENIKASPFDTINAYPIDDIWDSLKQWESDTVNSLNSNITTGLQNEITQWQGDISEKLKNELLQDLASDEGNIKQELDSILTSSLDDLINKEINDLKTNVGNDLNNAMLVDVANQIATIKPEITNDLHSSLSSELSTELSNELSTTFQNDINNWENSANNSLTANLSQTMASKSVDIHNSLSSELSSELSSTFQSDISNWQSSASNTLSENVAQSINAKGNELHNSLSSELSNELSSTFQNDINNWENTTNNTLNENIAQTINSKASDMKTNLSNEFTNYIAGQLSTYQTNATNTITANITSQVTQNIANEFNTEYSQVRADLENLVKGTIQTDVQNLLDQMQKNGDIYATKAEFDNFTSQINADLQKLDLANDIGNQIATINSEIQSIPSMQSDINNLKQDVFQFFGEVPSTTLGNIQTDGIYNLSGQTYTDGPHSGPIYGTILQNGRGVGVQSQLIFENTGHMYFRMINGWGTEGWFEISKTSDVDEFKKEIKNSAILRHDDISVANASSLDNLKDSYDSGIYYVRGNYNIAPSNSSAWGIMTMNKYSSGDVFLEYQDIWFNKNYFTTHNAGGWESWSTAVTQNDLGTSINQVNSEISSVQGSVASQSNAISSNASNISSLQSTASTQSSAINSNASNISSNASNISSLSSSTNSSLSTLSSELSTLSSNATQFVRNLNNNDDVNTITAPGIYGLNNVTPNNTPANVDALSGNLEVIGQNNELNQRLNTQLGNYTRSLTNGLTPLPLTFSQAPGSVTAITTTLPTSVSQNNSNIIFTVPQSAFNGWLWSSEAPVTTSINSNFATGVNFDNQTYLSETVGQAFAITVPLSSLINSGTYQTTAMTSSNGPATHTDHFIVGQFSFSYNSGSNILTASVNTSTIYNGPSYSNASTFGNQFISNISNIESSLNSLNGNVSAITVTSSNMFNATPSIMTYSPSWTSWTQNATENDISNLSNNLNTATSQLNNSIGNLQTQVNNVNHVYTLNPGTDFNQIPNDGIYDLANLPYTSYENAFYNGPGIQLQQRTGSIGETQMVWSNNDGNTPQVSYRVRTNGVWGRWILLASIDNVMGNTLCLRGDTPTNALSDATTTGIYNLAGKSYSDVPPNYGSNNLWGQMVVMNTGGVCTQTLYTNGGGVFNRTINSWGFRPWRPIGQ